MKNYVIILEFTNNGWYYFIDKGNDKNFSVVREVDGKFGYSSASLAAGAAEAWIRAKIEGPRQS